MVVILQNLLKIESYAIVNYDKLLKMKHQILRLNEKCSRADLCKLVTAENSLLNNTNNTE